MLKWFLHHICKIYHQTRCCIFSLNSLKGEIIVICIVLARKSTDFFWQGIANSGNQDTGLGFATNHGNSMRIFLRLFVAIWCPSIGVSIIHVKPHFSVNQNSGNKICFQNKNHKHTRHDNCWHPSHLGLYSKVMYISMSNLSKSR